MSEEKQKISLKITIKFIFVFYFVPPFTFNTTTMKKIKLLYWVVTGLFAAFMIFSSVSNVLLAPEAVEMLSNQLGYPKYIIPFLGVAKILGAIAILIPSFRRIKEWAYAGLCFDLVGAFYSLLQVEGPQPSVFFMLIFIGLLFVSYFLWHKKIATAA